MTDTTATPDSTSDITARYSFPPEHVGGGQSSGNQTSDDVNDSAPGDALGEARKQLARTHIALAATRAGVDVSGLADYMNVDAFLAEDGSVNADAVTTFVESLAPRRPAFDQEVAKTMGVRNSEPLRDFTKPQDFKGLTRQQIEALVKSGKLDKLVR
ncbi:hypothetical protein [Nonomuraea sp. NPDC052265]|uniref:hypothetical protein n=1 Tax=Nonomuraea sp. NPDC052265 TaxID=3364374 RepID=UPI0037C810EA